MLVICIHVYLCILLMNVTLFCLVLAFTLCLYPKVMHIHRKQFLFQYYKVFLILIE